MKYKNRGWRRIQEYFQCNEKKELGLVIISPFQVEKEYEIKITDEIIKEFKYKSPEDVLVYLNKLLKFRSKENYSQLKDYI